MQNVKENDVLQFTRLLFSLKLICFEPNVTRRIDDIWYLLKRASDTLLILAHQCDRLDFKETDLEVYL